MNPVRVFLAFLLVFVLGAMAHDLDIIYNCQANGKVNLVINKSIKCEVIK